MNPVSVRITQIREQLAQRAARRAEHRELKRQILAYSSESDRQELYAVLDRHTAQEGAEVRRILAGAGI
jgi:hypothetical protein